MAIQNRPAQTKPIRILLIEDDEDDYMLTRDLLDEIKSQQYILDWVNTYEVGLKQILERSHDIYLIDYRFANDVRTGLDLLKEVTGQGHEGPFILLTGLEDRDIDLKAMAMGAADYLVKGQIDERLLDRTIRYSMAHHSMLQAIRHSEKRKEMVLATLTHDLRTPVRAEFRVLEQLRTQNYGPLTPEQEIIIDELIKSNRIMNQMIDNILTSFKFEEGRIELHPEEFDLNEMITRLIQGELSLLAEEKKQKLVMNLGDLPKVYADPLEIRRVIYNFIQNALKFSPSNDEIVIETRKDGENIRVSVRDNGPGIEEEKLPTLFQPYASLSKKFKQIGTGLGLYLSQQIIDAHEGEIGVDSTPGEGSCFWFILKDRTPQG